VSTGLNPDNAKAVVGVLIGDALNQSSQYLAIGWCGFHIYNICHTRGHPKSDFFEKLVDSALSRRTRPSSR